MKKITLALCALLLGFFVVSCNNQSSKSDKEKDDVEKSEGKDSKDVDDEDDFEDDEDYTATSTSKDYIAAVKELMDDVSANWSADDWSDFMERYATLYIEFMESKPSEQLFKQFESIEPNMSNLSEEAQATAMKGIMQFTESSPLFQKVQDMQEELEKTFK